MVFTADSTARLAASTPIPPWFHRQKATETEWEGLNLNGFDCEELSRYIEIAWLNCKSSDVHFEHVSYYLRYHKIWSVHGRSRHRHKHLHINIHIKTCKQTNAHINTHIHTHTRMRLRASTHMYLRVHTYTLKLTLKLHRQQITSIIGKSK